MIRRTLTLPFLAALVTLGLVVPLSPAVAAHDVVPARVSGSDRFATAAEVARLQFPDGTRTAIVATGETFPDALAGASLAGAADAPVVLVRHGDVPDATAEVLDELGVENVYILGGTLAVSQDVEDELRQRYDVARLAGQSRFGTAAAVAAETARLQGGDLGRIAGLTTAFIANGRTFPDALAAGSLATTGSDAFPILLVESDAYPAETEQAIADLGIEQAIIVGGTLAVDEHVERHLEEDTRAVLRVAGRSREDTAVALAEFAMREFDYKGELVVLARSDDYPDALAAGLHAGRHDAPILLTPPQQIDRATHALLHDLCPAVEAIRAVGGTAAISGSTLADAVRHAEHCHAAEGQTDETYRVQPGRVDATAGEAVDLSVTDRYDGRPVQEPLDVTLFPCDAIDRATGTFADRDGDGLADDIRSTATGEATIESATEASRVEPRYAHDARFLHGALSWTVQSPAEDCTVTVVFDDRDGDDQLRVDAEGNALEHYGARELTWS